MAQINGTNDLETAKAFAKDYITETLPKAIQQKLNTFEEETLDLEITSKYDNLKIDEEPSHSENVIQEEADKVVQQKLTTFEEETSDLIPKSKIDEELNHSENLIKEQEEKAMLEEIPIEKIEINGQEPEDKVIEEKTIASVLETQQEEMVPVLEAISAKLKPQENGHFAENSVPNIEIINHSENHETISNAEKEEIKDHFEDAVDGIEEELEFPVHKCPVAEAIPEEGNEVQEETSKSTPEPEPTLSNGHSIVGETVQREVPTKEDQLKSTTTDDGEKIVGDEEQKLAEKLKKVGVADSLWGKKLAVNEEKKNREAVPVDKFRTIKQHIKRGNTRSLKERFESWGKINE